MKKLDPVVFCKRINKIHKRLGFNKRVTAINNLLWEFDAKTTSLCPIVYSVSGRNVVQNTESMKFEIK